jgi:ketosteroid isomerase-like protein
VSKTQSPGERVVKVPFVQPGVSRFACEILPPMSERNLEIVQAAVAAYNRGDWGGALEHATPDFELDFSRARGLQRGVFTLEEIPGWWDEFVQLWESVHIEADELVTAGDHVITPLTMRTTGRGGMELTSRVFYVWTFRDGAIACLSMYQTEDEALAATAPAEHTKG